jgi:hypothetical protein
VTGDTNVIKSPRGFRSDKRLEIGDLKLEIGDLKFGVWYLNFISNFKFEISDFLNIQISDSRRA